MVGVRNPRFTAMQVLDRHLALRVQLLELGLDVVDDELVNQFRRLVRH